MGRPSGWNCNADGPLHTKTGWTSVAVLDSSGSMYGDYGDGCYPVCALAH
jgi:hypothetical protein